jgi:DUF971 family protein
LTPSPIDVRKKPTDVKVHVTSRAGVDIIWADGHESHYDFAYLREQCPCAICDDLRQKKDQQKNQDLPTPAPNLHSAELPMFKPRPGARAAKTVGHYALQIDFTDGHSAGIFSYDYLRTICPCPQCASSFRSAAS